MGNQQREFAAYRGHRSQGESPAQREYKRIREEREDLQLKETDPNAYRRRQLARLEGDEREEAAG